MCYDHYNVVTSLDVRKYILMLFCSFPSLLLHELLYIDFTQATNIVSISYADQAVPICVTHIYVSLRTLRFYKHWLAYALLVGAVVA